MQNANGLIHSTAINQTLQGDFLSQCKSFEGDNYVEGDDGDESDDDNDNDDDVEGDDRADIGDPSSQPWAVLLHPTHPTLLVIIVFIIIINSVVISVHQVPQSVILSLKIIDNASYPFSVKMSSN